MRGKQAALERAQETSSRTSWPLGGACMDDRARSDLRGRAIHVKTFAPLAMRKTSAAQIPTRLGYCRSGELQQIVCTRSRKKTERVSAWACGERVTMRGVRGDLACARDEHPTAEAVANQGLELMLDDVELGPQGVDRGAAGLVVSGRWRRILGPHHAAISADPRSDS